MFNKIIRTPLIRLLIAFCTGISIEHYFKMPFLVSFILLILSIGVTLWIFSNMRLNMKLWSNRMFGIMTNTVFIIFGITLSAQQFNSINKSEERTYNSEKKLQATMSELLNYAVLKDNEYRFLESLIFINKYNTGDTSVKLNKSGLLYFLSVTGLNVGLIYGSVVCLLSFTHRLKYRQFLMSLTIISLIWFYTIITGFSETLTKVSVMLSIICAGKLIDRPGINLHSLSVSVLILLIINPLNFFNIGFQLSAVSISSILLLYPHIYNMLHISNKLINLAWIIFSASLSVQIGTLPLTIYYFHEFQFLFVLSNIILIPLTLLVYLFTMLTYLASGTYWMVLITGKLLHYFLWMLMKFNFISEACPFAISNKIFLSRSALICVYILIYFGIWYIFKKHLKVINNILN